MQTNFALSKAYGSKDTLFAELDALVEGEKIAPAVAANIKDMAESLPDPTKVQVLYLMMHAGEARPPEMRTRSAQLLLIDFAA